MFIITGGGSGIGRALAIALAQRNKSVLIVGRREQALQATASNDPLIQTVCADISTPEGLKYIKKYLEKTPKITALINNAGTLEPITPLNQIQPHEWHQALNTNLNAALFLPQQVHQKLKQGRVLNIGSGAAYFPIKGWGAYCVSKAALAMLTRCWQLESEDIAFASVMPGIIDTQMQVLARNGSENMDTEQINFYTNLKINNRLISPETVAAFLTWLLLDVETTDYIAQEWDIYDKTHHQAWLKPNHQVLHWDF
ncbi:MAG: SDR family NAD(P)-dependent oxidoreductase [Legionella sp.]|nr:SDR family NAD(P)-dependent oxidoreductase [Legionella sp.]